MGRSRSSRGRGHRSHRRHSGGGGGPHGGTPRARDVNPLQPAIDYSALPRDDDEQMRAAAGALAPELVMPPAAPRYDAVEGVVEEPGAAPLKSEEVPSRGRGRGKRGDPKGFRRGAAV